MADPAFRTTVSLVFWTDTTDEAQALVDQIKVVIPDEAEESVIPSIQFMPAGREVFAVPTQTADGEWVAPDAPLLTPQVTPADDPPADDVPLTERG